MVINVLAARAPLRSLQSSRTLSWTKGGGVGKGREGNRREGKGQGRGGWKRIRRGKGGEGKDGKGKGREEREGIGRGEEGMASSVSYLPVPFIPHSSPSPFLPFSTFLFPFGILPLSSSLLMRSMVSAGKRVVSFVYMHVRFCIHLVTLTAQHQVA